MQGTHLPIAKSDRRHGARYALATLTTSRPYRLGDYFYVTPHVRKEKPTSPHADIIFHAPLSEYYFGLLDCLTDSCYMSLYPAVSLPCRRRQHALRRPGLGATLPDISRLALVDQQCRFLCPLHSWVRAVLSLESKSASAC